MRASRAVFLLSGLLLACAAAAQPAPPLSDPSPARSAPGWTRQGRSLLLYDAGGALRSEIPLGSRDEGRESVQTLGGASPDGRLAWTLTRRLLWDAPRDRTVESRRFLRVLGADGRELWSDDETDAPESGDPVLVSGDDKVVLLARRGDKGWSVEARTWMGAVLYSAGPFPVLRSIALTSDGRYALARWSVTDTSDTHSFLDIAAKARRDVPSDAFPLGVARIGEDGTARSGSMAMPIFTPGPAGTR